MPATVKKKMAKPKTVAKKTAKPKAPTRKQPRLECRVCGYRVIVDQACGCAEEHTLICCGQTMAKKKS